MFHPVIKWSGSKRSQAEKIIKLFPKYDNYYEPFVGGGSVLYALKPDSAICGDICEPLINLWTMIQKEPEKLISFYKRDWERLQNEGYQVYYEIRERFNSKQKPEDFLFLSRTCVNGLIRFNRDGKFNKSLHHTRRGIHPERLDRIIKDWSKIIQNVKFVHIDYQDCVKNATPRDIIYLDPPYFNTKGRYFGRIDYDEFIFFLKSLNLKGVKYILSYDGMRGNLNYLKDLPKDLFKRHLLIESGNSSFKKVMDKTAEMVSESLYLNW